MRSEGAFRLLALAVLAALVAVPSSAAQQAAEGAPGEGVWRNYDFVPGSTVWRATDFVDEPVGRFPASQLEFVSGVMQIVEIDGVPMLEATDDSIVRVNLPEELPETFSLEFTARTATANIGLRVFFAPLEGPTSRHESHYLAIDSNSGIYLHGNSVSATATRIAKESVPVKLQVDGDYAILYVGSERVAQVPNAAFVRSPVIEFRMRGSERFPTYLSDVVVAVGLDSLYDALMDTGTFTTRGILFDTGSARLRPESTPVLDDIRRTLEEHPELAIVIEGHTDSVGDEGSNRTLSQARAEAVVTHLTGAGIDAGRLQADGKGESQPVADNDTVEGRQQNRRVVIRLAGEATPTQEEIS